MGNIHSPVLSLLLCVLLGAAPVLAQPLCPPADLTDDCAVDLLDLLVLADQWLGDPNCPGLPANGCANLNADTAIDMRDLDILSIQWGWAGTPVLINEFLASNGTNPPVEPDKGELLDEDGDAEDWIELHNITGARVNLSGWHLTDDLDNLTKWTFPAGTRIDGNSFLVVFASDKNRRDPAANLHTNFKLGREGEYLALVAPDGTIAHEYTGYEFSPQRYGFPPQERDFSYGLLNRQQRYFSLPTPGKPNVDAFLGFLGDVEVSHERGFYQGPIQVRLTCETSNAQIRYTLNGSRPTETNGFTYDPENPILIDRTTVLRAASFRIGYKPSRGVTHTYLFLDEIATQSADGDRPTEEWPQPNHDSGQWIDYGMDPDVTGDPRYTDRMHEALTAIPSICLSTDLEHLFDRRTGIYVNAYGDGRDWERPASMELINPDGSKGFQINAGLRIRGGFSRSPGNPKHSWRLFFRSEYGDERDANLSYPLFGEEGADEFDKIDLRTSQNYSWSFRGRWGMDNGSKNTLCRELFSRDTQREMGQPYTRSRYYHVYLNGQYWGLYQTQERSEARYAASYMGGDKEDYDTAKVTNDPHSGYIGVTDGTIDAYKRLWQYAAEGFELDEVYYRAQGLNLDGTPNAEYERLLDVDNLIDYMIVIYYTGNFDAPISNFRGNRKPNNFFATYNRENPDGWKFFAHDSEHSLFLGWDRIGPWTHPDLSRFDYFNPQWLHQQLMANDEYRLRFADRVHKYFFNEGLLTPAKAVERFLARAGAIDKAIIAESARWGDSKVETPRTRDDDWLPEIERTRDEYFPWRTDDVWYQFLWRHWYPWTWAPEFYINDRQQHGGMVEPGDTLHIVHYNFGIYNGEPNLVGTVWYTLDGTDPRFLDEPAAGAQSVPAQSADIPAAAGPAAAPMADDDPQPEAPRTIIWVTDSPSWYPGEEALDAEFTELLEDHGYNVVRHEQTLRYDLDEAAIAMLNAADLIIVSPTTLAEAYDSPDDWNSITTPLILLNGDLVRASKWDWVQTIVPNEVKEIDTTDMRTPVPDHDLFFNTSLTGGDSINIITDTITFPQVEHAGNGLLIGYRTETDADPDPFLWLAMWEPGLPFYSEQSQTPADARLFFAVADQTNMEQPYLLNRDGEQLFLNAVEMLLDYPEPVNYPPYVWAGFDQFIMWPQEEVQLNGYVFDDGRPEDPNVYDLTWEWSLLQGPSGGEVTFDPDEFALQPRVTFSMQGTYQLQLTASDGEKTASDTVWVYVATPAASIELTKSTRVKARVLLDGEWSALNEATYGIGPVKESLRISEILYNPLADPNTEFIELTNIGEETVNLHWASFTDGIRFTFPDVELQPDDYIVVARNVDAFRDRYGDSIPLAGEFEGKLSAGGERIVLRDAVGAVIQSLRFSDGWHDITDGEGFSLTMMDPAVADPNAWEDGDSWRPSSYVGGSPGEPDPQAVPEPGAIIVNEVLAHSHDEPTDLTPDWIELHNTTDRSISIGGWFLSDSNNSDPNRMKYRIPSGTTLAGGDFLTLYQDRHFGDESNPNCLIPFALSEGGESLYLRSARDAQDRFTGYFHRRRFDASARDVTLGRHIKSTGGEDFVAMKTPSPDDDNSYPKVGPIVITEIMYNPPMQGRWDNDEYEYIELMNISASPVRLEDLVESEPDEGVIVQQAVPWAFIDGIEFTFPGGADAVEMAPFERILVVRNQEAFEDLYDPPADVRIFQWESGRLNNDGEELELAMPGDQEWRQLRYMIRVDKVNFGDADPWPAAADAQGMSLHRRVPMLPVANYGNDPANWIARDPSPGR